MGEPILLHLHRRVSFAVEYYDFMIHSLQLQQPWSGNNPSLLNYPFVYIIECRIERNRYGARKAVMMAEWEWFLDDGESIFSF